MNIPTSQTPVSELVVTGLYHLAALEAFEETADLTGPFREVNDQLTRVYEARIAAERALAPLRAKVAAVDIELDALVLGFAEVVRATGGEDSTLFEAFFPKGVDRVVAPVGSIQAKAVRQILDALGQLDAAAELRDPWQKTLGDCCTIYENAIEARDRGAEALLHAHKAETVAREAWLQSVTKQIKVIEDNFPDSGVTQAVFFPLPSQVGSN